MKRILQIRIKEIITGSVERLNSVPSYRTAAASVLIFLFFAFAFGAYPVERGRITGNSALRLLSLEGDVLRVGMNSDGSYANWVPINEIPRQLADAVILAEDRRFYHHPGFDLFAMARATFQNLAAMRKISGGSTITQQLVRIAWGDVLPSNRYLRKIVEIACAWRVERQFSKDEILESYLNRIPLKFNQTGVGSAAVRIFGRHVRLLNRAECVALAVLIRRNNVDVNSFKQRFTRLWGDMYNTESGIFDELIRSIFKESVTNNPRSTMGGDHFADWFNLQYPGISGIVHSTISANLSLTITKIINSELGFLEKHGADNAAVIIFSLPDVDGAPMKLEVMVGSRNFFGEGSGQVNGCTAIRSAGSSLKPLLYALAIDCCRYEPYTILNDREVSLPVSEGETYQPRNNDLIYWGPMTVREALASSRNIPAVVTVNQIGVEKFHSFLVKCGFTHLKDDAGYYGPGIALGAGGTSLLQLCMASSALINRGEMLPLLVAITPNGETIEYGKRKRIMSEKTAWKITHILSDKKIRKRAFGNRNFLDFPFDVAAKTGTSKDYRDAWTVGYTKRYIAAVWVGSFSGKPMHEISGAWGAGRIFQQVIRHVTHGEHPSFRYPDEFKEMTLCRRTGQRARPGCEPYTELVSITDPPIPECTLNHSSMNSVLSAGTEGVPRILSPARDETYILDPLVPAKNQMIPIHITYNKNRGERGRTYSYSIDEGLPISFESDIETTVSLRRGEHQVRIYADDAVHESVSFTVR